MRRRTRLVRISAISWATKLPIEKPNRSTSGSPSAAMKLIASRAISVLVAVDGVRPDVAPTPTLSNAITSRSLDRLSISPGSQLSRLPRKC